MVKKIVRTLDKIEDACLVLMFAAMVGIIFVQVIMRYVFNDSLTWSEELGKFLFVWLSWIGISIGHRRREHIRITLLVDKLPPKLGVFMEALTEVILIVICGTVMYYGVIMLKIQIPVPYAGIKISTAWGYLSVVLGCAFMTLRALSHLIESVQVLRRGSYSQEGGTSQ